MLRYVFVVALLSTANAVAAPQQPSSKVPPPAAQTSPPLTAEQQAQLTKQNQEMVKAATQVAQLVDQGKSADVWEGSSSVLKQVTAKKAFVEQVTADRKTVGTPRVRTARGLTRLESQGGAVPKGTYVNVAFATEFTNEKQPVRELISFHFDADNVWRLSGYTVR